MESSISFKDLTPCPKEASSLDATVSHENLTPCLNGASSPDALPIELPLTFTQQDILVCKNTIGGKYAQEIPLTDNSMEHPVRRSLLAKTGLSTIWT